MVSDAELVERLREFVRVSDLTATTTTVCRKLEEDFAVDLTDKKVFIREQVDLFTAKAEEEEDEAEEGGDGDGEESSGEEEEEEGEEEGNHGSSRK